MYHGASLIESYVSKGSSDQISSKFFTDKILKNENIQIVLSLGCGIGDSIDYFKKKNPNIKWIGVDITESPEVNKRTKMNASFVTFDGVNIPFDDECIDLIFCHQAFEHVAYPHKLIHAIDRVLKSGGYLIGSTSHLEPFHSLSIQNFTPYGFCLLLNQTSLKMVEIGAGIDVFTLLLNRIIGRIPVFSKAISRYVEKESPVNFFISFICKCLGKTNQYTNLVKLLFCGHFRFLIQKINK